MATRCELRWPLARQSLRWGDVPVGAVVTDAGGSILGAGANEPRN
ncbi:MAG: hypothetical protein WKF47_02810 [Geodermatophilaceae bacterium]